MKTTSLFKAVALVAIMVASVLNSEVKAQDGFITNQVMNGELVASKTIFKQEALICNATCNTLLLMTTKTV